MKILVAGIVLFILSLSAHAQSVSESADANTVANSYNLASLKKDWTTVAALTHPHSLKQFRKLIEAFVESDASIAETVFGVKSKQALANMSDTEIFGNLFAVINKSSPEMESALKSLQSSILGSVEEGPDLRHFVYRISFSVNDSPISKVAVYPLKRFGSSWRVIAPDDEIRAMVSALSAPKLKTPPAKAKRKRT